MKDSNLLMATNQPLLQPQSLQEIHLRNESFEEQYACFQGAASPQTRLRPPRSVMGIKDWAQSARYMLSDRTSSASECAQRQGL